MAIATGIALDDRVFTAYNEMISGNMSTKDNANKKKAIVLRISPDLKTVTLEEGKEMLVGECDKVDDAYKHFFDRLPKNDCRYVVYSVSVETKDMKTERHVFIFWQPDSAPLKNKVVYSTSKDTVRRKLVGIFYELNASKLEDILDRRALATKLGVSNIISFEGKPV